MGNTDKFLQSMLPTSSLLYACREAQNLGPGEEQEPSEIAGTFWTTALPGVPGNQDEDPSMPKSPLPLNLGSPGSLYSGPPQRPHGTLEPPPPGPEVPSRDRGHLVWRDIPLYCHS